MKTVWKKGLTPEQQIELSKDFVGAAILKKRLKEILNERSESSYKTSLSKDGYNTPNWAYLQADARGYERALKEVISLLE